MELLPGYEDWKIWPPYEVFYIESLLTLTRTAISHYENLDAIITNQQLFDEDPNLLIDLAENIINQAAAVSRYLWPVRKHRVHELRGEKLREALKIKPDNILFSRDVRNFIEHFDENLDKVFNKPVVAGNFHPSLVVFNSSELNEVTFVFRAYIVNEFKYKSFDRQVDIRPIVEEIYRIYNILIEFNQTGRLK